MVFFFIFNKHRVKSRQNIFNKRITRQKPGKRISGNWRITVQLDKWLTSREGPDFSHCKISFPTIIPYPATLGSHFSQPTVNTNSQPWPKLVFKKKLFWEHRYFHLQSTPDVYHGCTSYEQREYRNEWMGLEGFSSYWEAKLCLILRNVLFWLLA